MNITDKLLLKPRDFTPSFKNWKIHGVFNPAAVRLPNKKILLYVRIAESAPKYKEIRCPFFCSEKKLKTEKIPKKEIKSKIEHCLILKNGLMRLTDISHFRKVILDKNGMNIDKIEQDMAFAGRKDDGDFGVEDPRIIKLGNKYIMTYVSVSKNTGISTSLAVSKDLKYWKRKGVLFREQNKDAVIFPEKIKGYYVALNRPDGLFKFNRPSIWISYSRDLIYWGKEKSLVSPRENSWEEERIGSGCPPIKTKKGWLVIYHGVKGKYKGRTYSAGAFLLGLKNPEKIIARTPKNKPLIKPEKEYEKRGYTRNVIFPTGIVKDLNKKDLLIYSGVGDEFISVKKISIRDILNSMEYY